MQFMVVSYRFPGQGLWIRDWSTQHWHIVATFKSYTVETKILADIGGHDLQKDGLVRLQFLLFN